jgi:hypothetical protein
MERRADWFVPMDEATFALWWVPASHIPSLDEGRQRLMLLRREDPTCHAFDLDSTFSSPVSVLTTVGHDLDIYRTANVLVKHYGEDAALEATQRADAMLEKGYLDGQRVWKRVLKAIKEIQRQEPCEGEAVN